MPKQGRFTRAAAWCAALALLATSSVTAHAMTVDHTDQDGSSSVSTQVPVSAEQTGETQPQPEASDNASATTTQEDAVGDGQGQTSDSASADQAKGSDEEAPAAAQDEQQQPSQDDVQDEPVAVPGDAADDAQDTKPADVTGVVTVRLIPSMVSFAQNATISMNVGGEQATLTKVADRNEWAGTVSSVAPGTTEVQVSGSGYATYRQQLEIVAHTTSTITLTDTASNAAATAVKSDGGDTSATLGVLAYGDFDGNGELDQHDASLLVAAERAHRTDAEGAQLGADARFDMNGDAKVNLTDVQRFASVLGAKRAQATVQRVISTEGMTVEAVDESGTTVEGTLEDGLVLSAEQTISAEHPATVAVTVNNVPMGGMTLAPNTAANAAKAGSIEVTDENDKTVTIEFGKTMRKSRMARSLSTSRAAASVQSDGSIVVDFGGQIAVKKIVIRVTESGSDKLADIGEVTFLNDMEDRIPPPTMNIPEGLQVQAGDKEFTLSWKPQTNITGYEVKIELGDASQTVATSVNRVLVDTFQGKKLVNGKTYKVSVRSVNGDWSSPFGDQEDATPQATKVPDAPENVTVTGKYRAIAVSWKAMEDAQTYTLYYKEQGAASYTKIDGLTGTSKTVEQLQDDTTYVVYLTASNAIGTSAPSKSYTGKTTTKNVKVPWYRLINRKVQSHDLASHITSVTVDDWKNGTCGQTCDPNVVVDGDYNTAWWSASQAQFRGATVEFDQEYEMDSVAITTYLGDGYGNTSGVQITTWDASGKQSSFDSRGGTASVASVSGAPNTFKATFAATKVKKIKVTFARYYYDTVTISELAFYEHDPVEDEINGLWADAMHVTLRDGVKDEDIESLRTKVNTPEAISQEYNTKRSLLLAELDNASKVLHQQNLRPQVSIDAKVSKSYDSHVGSQGLNAWQPLGIVANAGDKLTVYVGGAGMSANQNTELRLIATQYHAESSAWNTTVVDTLKIGANEVTIPQIGSLDVEHGGALYIEYKGNNTNRQYAVRVVGGTDIPVLDIHADDDDATALQAAKTYVSTLDAYVDGLRTKHEQLHKDTTYDEKNCVLNSTDIVSKYLMYSVPASQIKAALGDGDVDTRAQKLLTSLRSGDAMMTLFYQHKGLANNLTDEDKKVYGTNNALPTSRQNIRYMRMFAGAFMYAGGLHIGVEWDQSGAAATSPGVTTDGNGKYVSGNFFGWGIAHEVGHEINQGQYAVAEVTNNYFSQLSVAKDTDDSVRFGWDAIYRKVTSGAKGASSDVFTQLAMYWQLHLAYDDGYNYKTYDTYSEQMQNLFFARVDAYARNTGKAPAPKGVALTLDSDTDNNLMRLAAAAAQRDLTAFFEAWGMTPNEKTVEYVSQFEKETRPIQYMRDSARVYRIEGGKSVAASTKVSAELSHAKNDNHVKITITGGSDDSMAGYEIRRNGTVVGFVPVDKSGTTVYDDTIATVNNRVFTYEVRGVDRLMNMTEPFTLEPVKISTDGSMSKAGWDVTTNVVSSEDAQVGDEHDPCEPAPSRAVAKVIDGKTETSFEGTLPEGSKDQAQVTLSFNDVLSVTALKYRAPADRAIGKYEVQVSQNGTDWQTVKTGEFTLDDSRTATVYFSKEDDSWLYTYDAAYLRLVAPGQQTLSIAELDVLGPTGDDIEFIDNGIGKLRTEVSIGGGESIPAGSLVFTGTYKGNPAYNAIKLYDQDNRLIAGTQVIFAKVPDHGELGETADGRWVYYIEPDQLEGMTLPTSVRAELYRVDDAHTLQGERLVADTLPVKVPEQLPDIDISTK